MVFGRYGNNNRGQLHEAAVTDIDDSCFICKYVRNYLLLAVRRPFQIALCFQNPSDLSPGAVPVTITTNGVVFPRGNGRFCTLFGFFENGVKRPLFAGHMMARKRPFRRNSRNFRVRDITTHGYIALWYRCYEQNSLCRCLSVFL